jgi:hypothetical protein
VNSSVFTVSTLPALVFSGTGKVKVRASGSNVIIGGSNPIVGGFPIGNGSIGMQDIVEFDFASPSDIWAVCGAGSATVYVLSNY